MVVVWAFADNMGFAFHLHRKVQNRTVAARRKGQGVMMRSLIAIVTLIACAGAWAERLNANCSFERAIEYRMANGELYADELSQWGPIPVMTIANSITSYDPDGDDKNLATISLMWTRVGLDNVWSIWAGDFGDLLTIHSTDEPMGTYTATLQSSDVGGAQTYIGTCTGKF